MARLSERRRLEIEISFVEIGLEFIFSSLLQNLLNYIWYPLWRCCKTEAIVKWPIYSPDWNYLQFLARLEKNSTLKIGFHRVLQNFLALMNCFKLCDDDVKKFLLSFSNLLSVISIEVEGIEMHWSLNVNNYIAGRLDSVEICLVIVKDCVQNFHSLKRIF